MEESAKMKKKKYVGEDRHLNPLFTLKYFSLVQEEC